MASTRNQVFEAISLGLLAVTLVPFDLTAQGTPPPSEAARQTWSAPLPLLPEAAMVDGGSLWIARWEEGGLSCAEAAVGREGLKEPGASGTEEADDSSLVASAVDLWAEYRIEADAFPAAARVDAAGGHWFIWPDGDGPIWKVPANGLAEEEAPIPLDRPFLHVSRIKASGNRLFVSGTGENGFRIASTSLTESSGPLGWSVSPGLPENRIGADFGVVGEMVYLVGGGVVEVEDFPPVPVRHNWSIRCSESGEWSNWDRSPVLLPAPVPQPVAVVVNDLVLVSATSGPSSPAAAGHRVFLANFARGGVLRAWRAVPLGLSAFAQPLMAANEQDHQLLLAGGTYQSDGGPNQHVWAFDLPSTEKSLARQGVDRETPGLKPKKLEPTRYQTGLKRAETDEKFHVVFVLGEDEDSRVILEQLFGDGHAKTMLRGFIVSRAWPEDFAEVQSLIGTQTVPAAALLDSRGHVVNVAEKPTSRQDLFSLLKPAWGPRQP